jgi:cytosine/adenosine deaminase-related metal-dependent hydrolase
MRVISNLTVVTMDAERRVLTDAAIAIDGDRIVAVGSDATVRSRYPDPEIVDGRGMIAIPGLIDAHAHADQSLLRGATGCTGIRFSIMSSHPTSLPAIRATACWRIR